MCKFDPKVYWEDRGADYSVKADTTPELENLATIIETRRLVDILEVGSGYGRLYDYLVNQRGYDCNYQMCDFVGSFIQGCKERTGILPDLWDGKTLPYEDDSFKLVVSFSVALHVPPGKILAFLKEHHRVCQDKLFLATWYVEGKAPCVQEYCFHHDYPALFEEAGFVVSDEKSFRIARKNWLLEKIT